MKELGIGISTGVGIGGDPINGSSFVEILKHFEKDDETEAVLIIGEIGGPQEAAAAEYFQKHMSKPMAAYIAGLTAPPGRLMGHAGAIVAVLERFLPSCHYYSWSCYFITSYVIDCNTL